MRIRRSTRGAGLSVGIDLGTTFSAVARVNEQGVPRMLPNRDGEHLTPSVVFFDGEHPIVGTMAKRSVAAAPLDVVQFVKRSMGDPSWRFETDGGTPHRPEEISALILKRLRADAESALGAEVTDAVLTVPAYFDDAPRRATIDAGTIAGLNVRRVVNEPTAAALAYGLRGDRDGTAVVYDLGGGTFDVTVLRIHCGEFRVLATFGDRNLGGFDFDNLLMRLLNDRFIDAGGPDLFADERREADLRERTELAKVTLSRAGHARVRLTADDFSHTVDVSREEFEDVTSALLSRTRDIVSMVVEEAGLTWSAIDRILPAGGSTRMPMVHAMLEKVSGIRPDRSSNPDELVAHGAAVQAHLLDLADLDTSTTVAAPVVTTAAVGQGRGNFRLKVHDVTSHGLGEIFHDIEGPRSSYNNVVIPRHTPIPASGSVVGRTSRDNQRRMIHEITLGDDRDPEFVRRLGRQAFQVPPGYPKHSEFEITLVYDADQVVHVEVRDMTSGEISGTFELENVSNMTDAQIRESARIMRRTEVS